MIRFLFGVLLFICCLPGTASADIIISYQGGSIAPGGTGFLDVMIASDAPFANPDFLDSFSAHFRITPLGGAVSDGLQFSDPQNDTQLGEGNYVFAGNSLTAPPIGFVFMNTNTNDSYIGGDATLNAIPVSLEITQLPFLLFRLDLDATLANPGDQFTIQLVPDGSTEFLSDALDPMSTLPLTAGSFTPFTMTAAVPEPSTTAVLLFGSACFMVRRLRRRGEKLTAGHKE